VTGRHSSITAAGMHYDRQKDVGTLKELQPRAALQEPSWTKAAGKKKKTYRGAALQTTVAAMVSRLRRYSCALRSSDSDQPPLPPAAGELNSSHRVMARCTARRFVRAPPPPTAWLFSRSANRLSQLPKKAYNTSNAGHRLCRFVNSTLRRCRASAPHNTAHYLRTSHAE